MSSAGITIIRCDWKPSSLEYVGQGFCTEVFRSYSVPTVVLQQAKGQRWVETRDGSARFHLCPFHAAQLCGPKLDIRCPRCPHLKCSDCPVNSDRDSQLVSPQVK